MVCPPGADRAKLAAPAKPNPAVTAAASPSALVIVDLNARQRALDAVEQLCTPDGTGNPRRVIAFLSHVQTELAERALAAGCVDVMPRSKFTQNLAAILRGAKS